MAPAEHSEYGRVARGGFCFHLRCSPANSCLLNAPSTLHSNAPRSFMTSEFASLFWRVEESLCEPITKRLVDALPHVVAPDRRRDLELEARRSQSVGSIGLAPRAKQGRHPCTARRSRTPSARVWAPAGVRQGERQVCQRVSELTPHPDPSAARAECGRQPSRPIWGGFRRNAPTFGFS